MVAELHDDDGAHVVYVLLDTARLGRNKPPLSTGASN